MQRRLLSLLLLLIPVISCGHFLDAAHIEGNAITSYINPTAFIIAVLLVALGTWMMRSWVESDPDPFCLNLTFFAFAGQCIRTSEFIGDGNLSGILGFLLAFGFIVVLLQVNVLRAHMRMTREHYKDQLMLYKIDKCSDGEIDHWAAVLLRISGTDFSPGIYDVLTTIFVTEPREKSRKDAFSILPVTLFRKTSTDGLTADSLTVPPSTQRKLLWRAYVGLCVLSWIVFVIAMLVSQKKLG